MMTLRPATALVGLPLVVLCGAGSAAADTTPRVGPPAGLPLAFEENRGQADPHVRYLARTPGYTVWLTETEAILAVATPGAESPRATLRIRLPASAAVGIDGRDPRPGVVNYYPGADRTRWREGIPTFGRVHYTDLLPGIDLVFYGTPLQLEFDFVVEPGGDPSAIALAFDGPERLALEDGSLVAHTAAGPLRFSRPVVYQKHGGGRRPVSGEYVLQAERTAAFELGDYDRAHTLVIDPVASTRSDLVPVDAGDRIRMAVVLPASEAVFSTGGAVDAAGNIYGAGFTAADDFPTVSAYQTMRAGVEDWVVWSIDPAGPMLRWSTYVGGSASDRSGGMALGPDDSLYVVGSTQSPDFPMAGTPVQPQIGAIGFNDAAVVRFGATGQLLASTFLGGSADDLGNGIDVDGAGGVYVTGSTTGSFPVTPTASQPAFGGVVDAFVAKLDGGLGALVHATYLGGSNIDRGMAVAAGSTFVTGETFSNNFPLLSATQAVYGGAGDAFITGFGDAFDLRFSTYVGGNGRERLLAIGASPTRNEVIAVGDSASGPPFRAGAPGDSDGMLARLTTQGSLVSLEFPGGTGLDTLAALDIDPASGRFAAAGATTSTDFVTTPNALGDRLGFGGVGVFAPGFRDLFGPADDLLTSHPGRNAIAIAAGNADGDGLADVAVLVRADGGGDPRVARIAAARDGTAVGRVVVVEGTDSSDAVLVTGSPGRPDDIVVAGSGGVHVLVNNGDGTFAGAVHLAGTAGVDVARVVASGPRLAVAPRNANEVWVFAGGVRQQVIPIGGAPSDVAFGDVDNDGEADLAVVRLGRVDVFRFDPTLSQYLLHQSLGAPSGRLLVNWIDLGGPGGHGVIVTVRDSGFALLFRNTGGTLAPEMTVPLGPGATRAEVADFNDDGRADFAAANGAGFATFFLSDIAPDGTPFFVRDQRQYGTAGDVRAAVVSGAGDPPTLVLANAFPSNAIVQLRDGDGALDASSYVAWNTGIFAGTAVALAGNAVTLVGQVQQPAASGGFLAAAVFAAVGDLTVSDPFRADVAITKTAFPDTVAVGEALAYTLTIRNLGPDTAVDVVVTESVPVGAVVNSITPSQGVCDTTVEFDFDCRLGNLPAGATATVTVVVTPGLAGPLQNTASVTSATPDPDLANNEATVVTTVEPREEADLSIVKTGAPDPVVERGDLTYTITVVNNGPDTAWDVVVTDSISGSAFQSFGFTATQGSCTGRTCQIGDLAPGARVVITGLVAPLEPGTLTNTATVTSTTHDPEAGNDSATEETTVRARNADLSISKADAPDPVFVGGELTYTLTVANAGPDTALNVVVTESVPPESVTVISARASQGSCGLPAAQIVCDLLSLTPGAGAMVTLVVRPGQAATITNTASVSSDTPDDNPANDVDRETTLVVPGADLSIVKTASPDPVTAGERVTYRLTVTNRGPSEALDVVVTESVPLRTVVNSIETSLGVCDTTVEVSFDCRLGDLAPGTTATITVVMTPLDAGLLRNLASVTSDTGDPDAANNSSTVSTLVRPSAPTLSIDAPAVNEGGEGVTDMVFTVSLSAATDADVRFDFETRGVTATGTGGPPRPGPPAADFESRTGTLIVPAGQTTATIVVNVFGDGTDEPDETLQVLLTNVVNALPAAEPLAGLGAIRDDDGPPSVTVGDAQVLEGDSGTTPMEFAVSLSAPSEKEVRVDFSTADSGATAPSDYASTSGPLVFPAGVSEQTITVVVNGDLIDEGERELFVVGLSNPVNATLARATASGTIVDDDDPPAVSIMDTSVLEGDPPDPARFALFRVFLSHPTEAVVEVSFTVGDGTATFPSDFVVDSDLGGRTGVIVFPPGSVEETIDVIRIGRDRTYEPDETFTVSLTSAVSATIGDGEATGTILGDDPFPTMTIDDVEVSEGDPPGGNSLVFTVTLSNPGFEPIQVDFSARNGSAAAPIDFTAVGGTLVFPPGSIAESIIVPVRGDLVVEGDEQMTLELRNPRNATLARAEGTGTILDDDNRLIPSISIEDAAVVEGTTPPTERTIDTTPMSFRVSLSFEPRRTVRVRYATVDGTATGGRAYGANDYVRTRGTLTFPQGTISQTINVLAYRDRTTEDTEAFSVVLFDPVNATLSDDEGLGTIIDDDPRPTISFLDRDATALEGPGDRRVRLVVRLSNPTDEIVTVRVATQDGTATAPGDYQPFSSTLTFAPGDVAEGVELIVHDDDEVEGTEQFMAVLSDPQGADVVDPFARIQIRNTDYDADVNGDGVVDAIDLRLVRDALQSEVGDPAYSPEADVDRNGRVDGRDLQLVAQAIRESRR